MNNQAKFVKECQAFLKPEQLMLNEPMSKHTTFKIGGPADCLIFPASIYEVQQLLRLVSKYELPLTVLGNGSNVLVRDKGIRGVVIKFAEPMASINCDGNRIIAGAGAMLKDVSAVAADNALTGLEYACGIPGSIGGAVFMNAGAYDGETKNVADVVRTVTKAGEVKIYQRDELDLGYRHSAFQDNGEIICEVELLLETGDKAAIDTKIADFTKRRESKQPLELPSAGSTFKRPTGYFAGTLIDETGLKGLRVGGAEVSTKHAGFVVNADHATAADVINLINEVQRRVKAKHGVDLYPEVRIIGDNN